MMGFENTVYEVSGRVGGRVLTVEDAVVKGSHVDFGAEFIDSIHEELLSLAHQLNVELVDLHADTLTPKAYFFDGRMFTEREIVEAIKPFTEKLTVDVKRIPEEIHFSKADQFKDLDMHSVTSYLKSIGMEGWLLRFFEVAMESEYAMRADEQSAVNLLVMLSMPFEYSDHYHLLGSYHEVFKFKGGSQRLIDALWKVTEPQVKLGWQLQKISKQNNTYALSFDVSGKKEEVIADYVVMAVPFTVIRDIEKNFHFNEKKEKWITEAGFGNAIKVAMGFTKRVWREAGFQGYTFTDVNKTAFWDSSQMVPVEEGSITFAGGGDSAVELIAKSYDEIKDKWLTGADTIYPGLANTYNGKISKFPWNIYPYTKGSYTCYKPGQWSQFAGIEAEPHENIFFAGEHCSVKHQGFMNGAAETGKKAAEAIVKRLSVTN
jgi:monoamine oxidase